VSLPVGIALFLEFEDFTAEVFLFIPVEKLK